MFARAISLKCLILSVTLSACSMAATPADTDGPYTADWDSLKKHNAAPDWFRDAKFGIYFHWGVYSVPAFGDEWYPRNMHIKDRPEHKHHIENYGDPSTFSYHNFVPMFKAEKFDADEWADLFQQAGARFAGPVAEHHDGFSMWASSLNPWNAKDMGPKRDIAGQLAAAMRKRGIRFVTTFHHTRNRGWYPRVEGWPTTSDDPKLRILYGNIPEQQFNQMWLAKLTEVIENYLPDLIWFDSKLDTMPEKYVTRFLAHYFNKAEESGRQVVVTCKERDLPHEIAVEDFERGRQNSITDYSWLTDDTISLGSWCYTKDLKIKSTRYVLHVFIDIVSKNGQLLLNISPKADGTIPANQRQVLLGMGRWLKKHGEAIYGTRPFVVFGQGPTRLKTGGEYARTKLHYKPADIRFTTRGDTVYAIQLGWPGPNHETLLKSFADKHRQANLKINSVTMLASNEKIAWSLGPDGLVVTSLSSPPDTMAVVYKIQTNGIEHFQTSTTKGNIDNKNKIATHPKRAFIKPTLVRLKANRQQQFRITIGPDILKGASIPKEVKWSVNNIPGGNSTLGKIDPKGLYTAPKNIPDPPEIHICAQVPEAKNRHLFATILMAEPVYKLIKSWTEPKDTSPIMRDPHGIAVDKDGTFIVADRNISIVSRCTPDGKFLHSVGAGPGEKPGQFSDPRIAAIGPKGNIWITDCKEKGPSIQSFTPQGKLITAFGFAGSKPGQLIRCHGIDFDPHGRLFAIDVDNSRINVYSDSGEFLYDWGKTGLNAGQFNAPHGIGIDPSGDVFISNYYGPIQKYDSNGNFIFDFSPGDPVKGPLFFHSLTTDKYGDVYLILRREGYGKDWPPAKSAKKPKIAKFNNNGEYITAWPFPHPEHRPSTASVDKKGNIHCAFKSDKNTGIHTYAPH